MRRSILTVTVSVISVLFIVNEVCASVDMTGSFRAERSCDAYVSKSKRTNPDHIQLEAHKSYKIIEANRNTNPDWYRVSVPGATPELRWISNKCGFVTIGITADEAPAPSSANSCNTPGLEDSYKLALSWQPAFCETNRAKPECRNIDKRSYSASNFTLHGFWPNKASCGTNYGFCGEVHSSPGDFCDYPALNLLTDVRKELEAVMPSARAGTCLQRHEWYKHGTCQTKWSIDEYHELEIDLTHQFNRSGIAYFISRRVGQQVQEKEFFERVDCALGKNAHKRLRLGCKNGNLVDIYVNLPKDVKPNENLADLVMRAKEDFASNCKGSFKVDAIGFGH